MTRRVLIAAASLLLWQLAIAPVGAAVISGSSLIQVGGTYTLTGTNAPTSFSATVTVGDAASVVAGGTISVTHSFVSDGSGGEYVEIRIATVSGGPIGVPNLNWAYNIPFDTNGVPFLMPVFVDRYYVYWEADGAAFNPIFSFGGLINAGFVSPINGSPAFGGGLFPPFTIGSEVGDSVFVNPYNFANSGGVNTNTADAFVFGFHVFPVSAPVPEPSSLTLMACGVLGLAIAKRRRLRATR